ncbi:hypothetical protein G4G27_15225 [Sphingomonas sp. So64.6b]|uniref:hypothetical protein n=1 Tax=Sphingomonas sp. So64.6b TaxID=2997354 RepID=UPI0016028F17|nr:hypothetical protein [Sphingomonas sp. So64.6b]QNA85200.1 hypothetical protein G4G27_15225 [Sphingomonas sp. So64.6b]
MIRIMAAAVLAMAMGAGGALPAQAKGTGAFAYCTLKDYDKEQIHFSSVYQGPSDKAAEDAYFKYLTKSVPGISGSVICWASPSAAAAAAAMADKKDSETGWKMIDNSWKPGTE